MKQKGKPPVCERTQLTRQKQQLGERKPYNEHIQGDNSHLNSRCRKEMASTDLDMILCDRVLVRLVFKFYNSNVTTNDEMTRSTKLLSSRTMTVA